MPDVEESQVPPAAALTGDELVALLRMVLRIFEMPDKKTSQLPPAATLTGNELVALVQSGANVRSTTQAVADLGGGGDSALIESVTTGASPIDANISKTVTAITSGGTAGDEYIDLPNPDLPIDGWFNAELIGARHVLYLATQTNPSDNVRVTIGGGSGIKIKGINGATLGEAVALRLNYVGAAAVLIWQGEEWFCDLSDGGGDVSVFGNMRTYLPSVLNHPKRDILSSYNTNVGWGAMPIPGSSHAVATGAAPVAVDPDQYCTQLVTGGTAGVETVSLNNSAASNIGNIHVFELDTLTNPADSISLSVTNIQSISGGAVASIVFDTVHEYLVLELWEPNVWRILRGTAAVTPA